MAEKYINAYKLKLEINVMLSGERKTGNHNTAQHALKSVRKMIDYFPAADVVEVVRCKDCKWYKESKLLATNKFCFRLKDRNGDRVGYNFAPDDFCSYGERKELDNGKVR